MQKGTHFKVSHEVRNPISRWRLAIATQLKVETCSASTAVVLGTEEEKTPVYKRAGVGDYSSLIDVTFNVSPCTSPLTSTRRWSFLSDALSASTIFAFPSASNFRNCLSFVTMP